MPCRCDEEPISSHVHHELEKRAEHLESQLCNARSLIHKLIKFIRAQGQSTYEAVPPDLRSRAHQHVQALLAHKRAEAKADLEEQGKRLRQLEQVEESTRKTIETCTARLKEIEELRASITRTDLTDEGLLG